MKKCYIKIATKKYKKYFSKYQIYDILFGRILSLLTQKINVDIQTGKDFNRARYEVLKEDVFREGDVLIILEYDRLGRADQTREELEYFKRHG